jgi:hypothetical protein
MPDRVALMFSFNVSDNLPRNKSGFDFKIFFKWFIGKEVCTFYRFLPVVSVS